MDKASHFDIEALSMLEEIMEDEFPELIQVYIDDSDPRITALQRALEQQDCTALRDISHSFKGASGNISALPLADLCFKLEEQARIDVLESIPSLITAIDSEYQNVKSILLSLIP
ncbi:MAG: Hpt domain-containing protein [Oleispira sp.]|nr:Hpt domain-containing protein [Oleispira sp.]MBL4881723.1 Hpt domain-containing protein [Oleispira sp.]MBL4881920.1 Hpt domain-containing protein [Oleispira sp.]